MRGDAGTAAPAPFDDPSTERKGRGSSSRAHQVRTRIEEGAPSAVLFALAITVVMITSGIIYVLAESGSKFYKGFGCGADDFTPPQDWSEEVKVNVKQAAIYDEGSLSDPLWLDRFCIVGWDNETMVALADPFVQLHGWDADEGSYDADVGLEASTFNGVAGPALDPGRPYLEEYFEAHPEHWDSSAPSLPLSVLRANEPALILHQQNPELARSWWVTVWAWSDTAQTDVDEDGVPNDAVDGTGVLLDNDLDGDGIVNHLDDDLDNDGLPNAYDPEQTQPQVDGFGLLLGLLTLTVIVAAVVSPTWLHRIGLDHLETAVGAVRAGAALLTAIATMALLVPLPTNILLLLTLVFLLLAGAIFALERRWPIVLLVLAAVPLVLAVRPFHAVQTGHAIALGMSLLATSGVMSESRNQVGGRRVAIVDGDVRALFWVAGIMTVLLCYFDLVARVNGSLGEFLTQTWWKTDVRTVSVVTVGADLHMGVNSLLQTTLQVALGALVIAIPIGLGTAIYLSEYASPRMANVIKPVLELLAGIPSVVYGFFAFVVIAPIVVDVGEQFLEWGWIAEEPQMFNPLNGAIVVGIMITPLIASLSEDALRAVPDPLRHASYALGATPVETTARVTVPSALSGILASIILALSRAVGETMAVTLSVGTLATYSDNMFRSAQTMTAYIAQRIGGELPIGTTPYYSLFAVGLYLFFITLGLNMVGHRIMTRFREAYE